MNASAEQAREKSGGWPIRVGTCKTPTAAMIRPKLIFSGLLLDPTVPGNVPVPGFHPPGGDGSDVTRQPGHVVDRAAPNDERFVQWLEEVVSPGIAADRGALALDTISGSSVQLHVVP